MRALIRRTSCLSTPDPVSVRLSFVFAVAAALGASGCANGVAVGDTEFEEIRAEVSAGLAAPPGSIGTNNGTTGGNNSTASDVSVSGDGIDGIGNDSQVIPSPPLTGGNCNGATPPVAVGGCAQGGALSVTYTDNSSSASVDQLRVSLGVQNTGADFNLSDLVIRYWFTADGNSGFTADIDYVSVGSQSDVCVNFGDAQGSGYADVGFTFNEPISGDGFDEVKVRIHTGGFDSLNQSNDFSFMGGADGVNNQNITVYLRGERVGGCEPQ